MLHQVTALGLYGGPIPLTSYGAILMNEIDLVLSLAGPVGTSFPPVFPAQQCQVSDGGIDVVVQVLDGAGNPVNLRAATGLTVIVNRPSGVVVEVPAVFYSNGLDGKMAFATGVDTPYGTGLDEPGIWLVQGKFALSGNAQYTSVGSFYVRRNLGA